MFQECEFTYAGKSSADYGLMIVGIDNDGSKMISGSKYEPVTGHTYRNSEDIFYGLESSGSLEFPVEIASPEGSDIPYEQFLDIKDWLFGQEEPQRLIISHPDLSDYYFLCLFQSNEDICYTGGANGISATVRCMTPFAYKINEHVIIESFSTSPTTSAPFLKSYYIQTADIKGVCPIVKIEMKQAGNVSIENLTNNSELCFENVSGSIVVDCQKQIITPTANIDKIQFHYNVDSQFLRLKNGENNLRITGDVKNVTITVMPSRRVGGG